ncbi:alanine--tRNA ligase [Candidatus Uhrbacteria bacterium]|nr:alanine--tRNA ligase [Candidatus Uhrbacteria bacterium]
MLIFMTAAELRQKYLDFFKEKGHAVIPSASIVPQNDPTVLFTTAGMQPLIPFLSGNPHPMGSRLVSAQKCLRTDDIEEVGDNRHLTFFEMLGNWSLGDYFKPEAITWAFEFLTDKKWLGLDPKKIYVTVFEGDEDAIRDEESIGIWQSLFEIQGIAAEIGVVNQDEPTQDVNGARIYAYPKKKNWWPGATMKGLCGPDTEIFYDTGKAHQPGFDKVCNPNCDCGRFVEIWNNVFMQFNRLSEGGALEELPSKNVDTGMGLERMVAMLNGNETVFETPEFEVIISAIEQVSHKKYHDTKRAFRIIADHIRASTFVIGDPHGVVPSNIGQGYIVRRLLRRAIREGHRLGLTDPFLAKIAAVIIGQYGTHYTELETNRSHIVGELQKEEDKFAKTIEKGTKEFEKMANMGTITGEQAFMLFSTYGFPIELTEEMLRERGSSIDREVFAAEFKKHQELSRTASAGMFKGGLADHSIESTRLHTATHLLHRALKNILGEHVEQKGSNITSERLRFDFSHPEKLTPEQIKRVEDMVNAVIDQDLPVHSKEMTVAEAKMHGAIGLFEEKYGDKVKVYFIGNEITDFSKEICGGPHVTHTGDLGKFKIQKEEAVSAGIRRIKASVSGR